MHYLFWKSFHLRCFSGFRCLRCFHWIRFWRNLNLKWFALCRLIFTAWKVSVFRVFLVHIFPAFWVLRIQSKCWKVWTRKTPNTDTFLAVSSARNTEFKRFNPNQILLKTLVILNKNQTRLREKCNMAIRLFTALAGRKTREKFGSIKICSLEQFLWEKKVNFLFLSIKLW